MRVFILSEVAVPDDAASIRGADLAVLGLSKRVHDVLTRRGFGTVGDLLALSEAEFLRVPNLGRKGIREVREKLAGFIGPRLAPGSRIEIR